MQALPGNKGNSWHSRCHSELCTTTLPRSMHQFIITNIHTRNTHSVNLSEHPVKVDSTDTDLRVH